MQYLRIKEVSTKTGLSKSEIWARSKSKTFPSPISLSTRITVWDLDDVENWMLLEKKKSRLQK